MRLLPLLLTRPAVGRPRLAAPAGWDAARWALLAGLLVAGGKGVFPYADCAHDGTRLAGIESLGVRGTFAIDESVYVKPPPAPGVGTPYRPDNPFFFHGGTIDKFYANGHFYSHHPPVSLVLLGGVHRAWRAVGGPDPAAEPGRFAKWMTRVSAVLQAVLALGLVGRLARRAVGLAPAPAFAVVLLLAVGTMGPAYTRHVTAHTPTLLAAAAVCYAVAMTDRHGVTRGRLALLGTGVGAAYALDGAVGPATGLCGVGFVGWRAGWRAAAVAAGWAAPWAVAHHGILLAVTGSVWSPATNPAFWQWEGSPFTADNLTGVGIKHTPWGAVEYGYGMLFGPRGFVTHNPPVLAAALAAVAVAVRCRADRPVAVFALGWAAACALPYVLGSNNFSGRCLSVRWFLPLLAPAGWVLAVAVARMPGLAAGVWAAVPACGLLGYRMYRLGPWIDETETPVPGLLELNVLALVGWCGATLFTARLRPPEQFQPPLDGREG